MGIEVLTFQVIGELFLENSKKARLFTSIFWELTVSFINNKDPISCTVFINLITSDKIKKVLSISEVAKKVRKENKFWVVFTGDSITSCEWVHPNWREIVEYVIKEETTKELKGNWKTSEWGIRGFNFAYDGATTADILDKIGNILLVKPDLVISVMGGNDSLFNIPVNKHAENLGKIIKKLTKSGSKVVWCTSTPSLRGKRNVEYEPYARAIIKIAVDKSVQIIDLFNIYKKFPLEKLFTYTSEGNPVAGVEKGEIDPDHPNQLGNAYIAKVILKEVFLLDFNPEKYISDTLNGEKYPGY